METVLLVPTPEGTPTGRAVLRALDDVANRHEIELRAAAVVERQTDGRWLIPEETEKVSYRGTITAGALGALIGLMAGPGGAIVGGTAGLMVGSSVEIGDARDVESVVAALPRLIRPGTSAVIADLFETDPVPVDRALLAFGLTAWRMTRDEAEARIAEEASPSSADGAPG